MGSPAPPDLGGGVPRALDIPHQVADGTPADAPYTGSYPTSDGCTMVTYFVSTGNTHHLFGDLTVLSDVRQLDSPVTFMGGRIRSSFVGTFRIKRPSKPDVIIPNVYWSPDTHVNVLCAGRCVVDFCVRSETILFENGLVIKCDTPQLYGFRLPNRSPAPVNPERNWDRPMLLSTSMDVAE